MWGSVDICGAHMVIGFHSEGDMNYVEERRKGTNLFNTELKWIYKIQYILCNNTNKYSKGFRVFGENQFNVRQNVLWYNWVNKNESKGIDYLKKILYMYAKDYNSNELDDNRNYISGFYVDGIVNIDANAGAQIGTEENYFDEESRIYSEVLMKKRQAVAASSNGMTITQDNNTNPTYYILNTGNYTGIITGIYALNENQEVICSLNNYLYASANNWNETNKIKLEKLSMSETNKKIYIRNNISGMASIKIQIASTNATLKLWHLKNKSLYNSEGVREETSSWGTYSERIDGTRFDSY